MNDWNTKEMLIRTFCVFFSACACKLSQKPVFYNINLAPSVESEAFFSILSIVVLKNSISMSVLDESAF